MTRIIIQAITIFLFIAVLSAECQEFKKIDTPHAEHLGIKYLSEEGLETILSNHKEWLTSGGEHGKRADLNGFYMSGIDLSDAELAKAHINGAYLNGAKLNRANLNGAQLMGAKLIKADLSWANLQEANLIGADLSDADLRKADLMKTIFEPNMESISTIKNMCYARNLSELVFSDNPKFLIILREDFKKSGLRRQEREVTHAIQQKLNLNLWRSPKLHKKIEAALRLIFFDITCKYGMKPGRPFNLLMLLIVFFSIPYTVVLLNPPKEDTIWKVWIKERTRSDLGTDMPARLGLKFLPALATGFYFSVLSAFSIGWREFNVGTWISRIQPREYTLRPTGWVRTVSGIQALISIFLLALSVLAYFGRPFEAF